MRRAIAERALGANNRNFGPARDIIQDDRRITFTLERLGDRKQALDVAQRALSMAAALVTGDPQTRTNRELLEDQRGISVRLAWLISDPAADFRSILGGESTPRRIQSALARGWRLYDRTRCRWKIFRWRRRPKRFRSTARCCAKMSNPRSVSRWRSIWKRGEECTGSPAAANNLEIVQVRLAALQGDKTLVSNVEVSRPLQINQ